MHSILAWASAHPELVVGIATALVNLVFGWLKLFSAKSPTVAFVAKIVAAVFPDPAEIIDAIKKALEKPPPPAGGSLSKGLTAVPPPPPKPPTVDRRSAGASISATPSGARIVTSYGAAVAVAVALPACAWLQSHAPEIMFSADVVRCVIANVDLPPLQVASKCGTQLTPELLTLIESEKASQKAAADKALANAGACKLEDTPKDAGGQ